MNITNLIALIWTRLRKETGHPEQEESAGFARQGRNRRRAVVVLPAALGVLFTWPCQAASGPNLEGIPQRNQSTSSIVYWPERGFVPYEFWDEVTYILNVQQFSYLEESIVRSAILEWNQKTAVHLVNLQALQLLEYGREFLPIFSLRPITLHRVSFAKHPERVCSGSSPIGIHRRDEYGNYIDTQFTQIGSGCENDRQFRDVALHEIGHAIGLIHEHQRIDRNRYVQVEYTNAGPDRVNLTDTAAIPPGAPPYNYRSVMHYGEDWMAVANARVETIPPGIPLSSETISPGDVDRLYWLYREQGVDPMKETVVDTNPSDLEIIVDGERYRTPARFRWAEGDGPYRIEAPAVQTDRQGHEWRFARWNTDKSPFGSPAKSVTVRWGLAWHEANYALSD